MQYGNVLKIVLMFLSLSLLLSLFQDQSIAAPNFANSNFRQLWEYSDKLVDEIPNPGRGFTWGPNSFAVLQEDYQEGVGGKRQVQYFDKSRMELATDGRTVTNGLLTKELVTGQQQVGNSAFVSRTPAITPVAGDSDNANAPNYASFKNVITSQPGENTAPDKNNQIVNSAIDKAGNVTTLTNPPAQVTIGYYEPLLGHNVPTVFLDYQNIVGRVWNGSAYTNGRVYTDNPTANVFGLPISEPFWIKAKVGGVEKDILTQLFERRVLTYTPSNPDPFKVEMGNIGQHYYQWRYAEGVPAVGAFYDAGGMLFPDPRPNQKSAPLGKPGGELKLAFNADLNNLHPHITNDVNSTDAQNLIYAAALSGTDLATGLPTLNFGVVDKLQVSPDRLTYTYTLRNNIKWSDGVSISADDYTWTYRQVLNPTNKYPFLDSLQANLETVTAQDSRTVIFKFKKAGVYAIRDTGLQPLPKHIWENLDWTDPTKNSEIVAPTVVSGPWQFKEWVRGSFIRFVRNPASTILPVPQLDSITIYLNNFPGLNGLVSNSVDVASIGSSDYNRAINAAGINILNYFPLNATFEYTGLNFRKPYLQDLALRQALAYAVPQQEIINSVEVGQGQPIYSNVPQTNFFYNPATPKYNYNLTTARTKLAEAGYRIEGGRLIDKNGNTLPELKLYYNSEAINRRNIAGIIQASFAQLGIRVNIYDLSFQSLLTFLRSEPFDYDLYLLGWRSTPNPETFGQVWENIPSVNYGAWDNEVKKQVVNLYDQALEEFDLTKRKSLVDQIQILTAQDVPYFFIYERKTIIGFNSNLIVSPVTGFGINYNLYADWSYK
jgi:ABC-type transport system substrate-binding protein